VIDVTADRQPQHLEALELANTTRMWRTGAKYVIASLPEREGRLACALVVVDRPKHLETMTVSALLGSIRSWGRQRTTRFLLDADIVENKPVGTLTDRQANLLAGALTDAERVG
jgi:hypothetical protein